MFPTWIQDYTPTYETLIASVTLLCLAYAQNISFSIVSRARNRSSMRYHFIAAILSNGVWFLTFRSLVTSNMSLTLFVPYTVGTVAGSITGAWVSAKIEKLIGATSDVAPVVKLSEKEIVALQSMLKAGQSDQIAA